MSEGAETNPDEVNLIVKRGILDSIKRPLIITKDFIEFKDKDLLESKPTRFYKEEITGYRYGLTWIEDLSLQ